MDILDAFIATLHALIGHDATARFIGVQPGDKRYCRLCSDGKCPDCGQLVFYPYPLNRPGEDRAWSQHFDYCEPHIARVAREDGED